MGRIRVEPESSAKELPCRMCGGVNRLLHGYVYDDEDARGSTSSSGATATIRGGRRS